MFKRAILKAYTPRLESELLSCAGSEMCESKISLSPLQVWRVGLQYQLLISSTGSSGQIDNTGLRWECSAL